MWTSIVSGVFLLVGSGLAFYGTYLGHKAQKEVARMQINEKLIAENKINWSNETRKLIAKFIRDCFNLNHVIKDANLIQEKQVASMDINLTERQRERLKPSTEELKRITLAMSELGDAMQVVAEIRLHIFDADDKLGNEVLEKIILIEQHYSSFEEAPSNELNELTELARKYFKEQWEELTTVQ